MSKLKVLELFGGIASFSKGLQRAGIPHEIVDYVDIDKYATQAFNAIHGTNYEPQDIAKWDKNIEADIVLHGSSCQDFSLAGKGRGGDKGSGTRSSLMWETVRIVEKLKPKYVCWENVKGLLTKKHKHNFDAYLKTLEDLGYNNYWQVLNAKDYLIPQNRERVFTISIRKDIDNGAFTFPVKTVLEKRLKDILEPKVDEKYYLSDERLSKIKLWDDKQRENGRGFRFEPKTEDGVSRTLTTSPDRPAGSTYIAEKPVRLGGMYDNDKGRHQAGGIFSKEALSPTLDTCSGGNRMPYIKEPKIVEDFYQNRELRVYDGVSPTLRSERTGLKVVEPQPIKRRRSELGKVQRKVYENHELPHNENMKEAYAGKDGVMPTITCSRREQKIVEPFVCASRGRDVEKVPGANPDSKMQQRLEPNKEGCSFTITSVQKDNYVAEPIPRQEFSYRIRRLTAKECWRLMNRDDWEYDKAEQAGISQTQLYKIAGNSIVASCTTAIFSQLFGERKWNQMTIAEREAMVYTPNFGENAQN